jgi:hypothetical protein
VVLGGESVDSRMISDRVRIVCTCGGWMYMIYLRYLRHRNNCYNEILLEGLVMSKQCHFMKATYSQSKGSTF